MRYSDDLQERIRQRAYFLWQAAGEPEGRGDFFYREAEKQEVAPTQPAELGTADLADDPAKFAGF